MLKIPFSEGYLPLLEAVPPYLIELDATIPGDRFKL